MLSIPPVVADLTWLGRLKFSATVDRSSMIEFRVTVDLAGQTTA
jgi:hypothetical protein